MGLGVGSGVGVVGLSCAGGAIRGRDGSAASVRAGVRIVGSSSMRGSIGTVGRDAGAVDAAVPCRVSVVGSAVIHHSSGAVPAAVPIAVSPTVSAADCGADRDTNSEGEDGGGYYGCGAVARRDIGSAVDDGGVVLRDVDHLR